MSLLGNLFKKAISVIAPPWWQVTGDVEAIFYLSRRSSAMSKLNAAKASITNTVDLAAWYAKSGLRWMSERVDHVSLAWVAIAKGGGDCDDFMSITYEIMSNKLSCRRVILQSTDGRGHAIVVIREGSTYTLMSNMSRKTGFATIDAAARDFYGNKTKTIYYI